MYGKERRSLVPHCCFVVHCRSQHSKHSSTSLPCAWLPPSFRSVDYLPVSKIDLRTLKQKRKRDLALDSNLTVHKKCCVVPKPTESALTEHYAKLSKTKHKPLLLSLEDNFNDSYVPLYVKGLFPEPLTLLYSQQLEETPLSERRLV